VRYVFYKKKSGFVEESVKERNGKVYKYNIAGLKTRKKTPEHIY